MTDLRVEIRFKNAVLYRALAKKFPQKEKLGHGDIDVNSVCQEIGISRGYLYQLLSLRVNPWLRDGQLSEVGVKLSFILEVDEELLFPRYLYKSNLSRKIIGEIDSQRVLTLAEARHQKLLPESTEDIQEIDQETKHLIRLEIERALTMLTPREEKVIRLRFGIDGPCMSHRQIGDKFAISGGRVQQIEARALRKLRHPSRSGNISSIFD